MIPYFPHIVCISAGSKNDGLYIKLSKESSVDISERSALKWYLSNLLKDYNRCKRNKVEFNIEESSLSKHNNKEIIIELAKRVKEYGNKATIDGLHTYLNENYYRKNLVDEMLKYGLDPTDWGYGRFVNNGI